MKTKQEIEAMSMQERRIKTAELCPRIINDGDDEGVAWCWQDDAGTWHDCLRNDPLCDLNAMRAAERVMKDMQAYEYRECLRKIAVTYHFNDGMCGCSGMEFFHPAKARNTAFLMVML